MIKAKHTTSGKVLSDFYSGYKLGNAFDKVSFYGEYTDSGLPLLIIANHFSWWDGFIQYRLNKTYFSRKLHVMMLEEQLKKFMILNKCGVFSVRKNSRDIIESLNYSVGLLKDKNNAVLIFPQGKIESLYTEKFTFEKGLNYLFRNIKNDFRIIFNINLVDYFSEKKPSLYICFKQYDNINPELNQVEKEFNDFAAECKSKQKEK